MRLTLALCLSLWLVGCAGAPPVKHSFPDVPVELMTTPEKLKTLKSATDTANIQLTDDSPSDVKMSDLLRVITENYKISNNYLEQIKALQTWIKLEKELNP